MKADARAVWDFAQTELGFKDHQIILFGESLGGHRSNESKKLFVPSFSFMAIPMN